MGTEMEIESEETKVGVKGRVTAVGALRKNRGKPEGLVERIQERNESAAMGNSMGITRRSSQEGQKEPETKVG